MNDPTVEELQRLSELLGRAPRVARVASSAGDEGTVDVATEAAAGLLDIRSAMSVLFNQLLPRLSELDPSSPEFDDVLDGIAEEYRHIYYHISNSRLFNYVVPPA